MLNGKKLGKAIETAINLKIQSGAIRSKADVATHFGVKTPSIYDWINRGTISKNKLIDLWDYFSDVVGPEHWGMCSALIPKTKRSPPPNFSKDHHYITVNKDEETLLKIYRTTSTDLQMAVQRVLDIPKTKRKTTC